MNVSTNVPNETVSGVPENAAMIVLNNKNKHNCINCRYNIQRDKSRNHREGNTLQSSNTGIT